VHWRVMESLFETYTQAAYESRYFSVKRPLFGSFTESALYT